MVIDRKITNPKKRSLIIWILLLFISSYVFFVSYIDFDINSSDGLFIMVSVLIGMTSIIFIPITFKHMKLIDRAINEGENIAFFRYKKDEWESYIRNERDYRITEGKNIAKLLSLITGIIFIPFILIIEEGKLTLFLVMISLFGLYILMALLFPKMVYMFRTRKSSRAILLKKGILIGNQFHTWNLPLSSFYNARHKKVPYEHIAVIYEFVDRTGPRKYTVNVPIPKDFRKSKKDISEIISQFE